MSLSACHCIEIEFWDDATSGEEESCVTIHPRIDTCHDAAVEEDDGGTAIGVANDDATVGYRLSGEK